MVLKIHQERASTDGFTHHISRMNQQRNGLHRRPARVGCVLVCSVSVHARRTSLGNSVVAVSELGLLKHHTVYEQLLHHRTIWAGGIDEREYS